MFLRGELSTKTTAPLRDARADSDECIATNVTPPDPSELDPESLLTERETARSGYESRLAAVGLGGAAGADESSPPRANVEGRGFRVRRLPAVPPVARLRMRRSGFAGCSTVDLPVGEYLDLDAFTALRYRVLSDGRKYVVSIRTENWITGQKEDLWQAFLFSPAGRWADVYVPMKRFLKTWRGRVMEHEHEMRASRVVGLGIAVAGGGEVEPEGPFAIKVASIAGVRLGAEALEMARRREEAAWASGAPSPGIAGAGEQTGDTDAWGFAERNESDGGFDEEPTSKLPKSVAGPFGRRRRGARPICSARRARCGAPPSEPRASPRRLRRSRRGSGNPSSRGRCFPSSWAGNRGSRPDTADVVSYSSPCIKVVSS